MNGNKFVYTVVLILFMINGHSQNADSTANRVFLPEDSSRIKVRRLEINSVYSDFSPVLVNNVLTFASGRPAMLAVSYANELKTEITDLYSATRRDSVNFSKPRPFPKIINTMFNEASFTYGKNGSVIYFTGNARPGKNNEMPSNKLQIFKSEKLNEVWSAPEEVTFCKSDNSNCHPALSADNQLIVFCSNMAGGYGGTDLYCSRYENNNWTAPVNLGPRVNSPANELFPCLSGNSQLYFSTNKAGGLGGLDIYSIDLNSSDTLALPLSDPINSTFDDFGICPDSACKSGYFTSNRKASTGDDIYYFSIAYPDFSRSVTPPVKNKFCYSFFEENDYKSNDSVKMSYEWNFGDGTKIREDKCRHCFKKPGDYLVQLNVVEKNSGEVFFNQVSYTLTVDEPPRLFVNCPDTILAGVEILMDAEKSAVKGNKITGCYWSFGDGKYNTGAFVKHKFKKGGIYKVELGVTTLNEQTRKAEKFKVEKNIVVKKSI